jgi:alkylhydroperoxidase family enzyme
MMAIEETRRVAQKLRQARKLGERRLHLLNAWEESPFYSDRERAALTWFEAVTRITEGRVPDESISWRGRSSTRRNSST